MLYAAASYRPSRNDFVRVWRGLGDNFVVDSELSGILQHCPRYMEAEKYCLCLMVLLETGLLKSGSGRIFGARKSKIGGKADLDATELIKALKNARR